MAKLLSQVATTLRGSVGGITYTANQWHAILMRARVSPVNPNTTHQSEIRSAFAGAQGAWLALSDTERELWDDYALTCVYPGPLGNYTIPGRLMFAACYGWAKYLETRGIASIVVGDLPPSIPGWLPVDAVTPSHPATPGTGVAVSVTITGTESVTVIAEVSWAFNPTRYRFKGPFKSSTLQGIEAVAPGQSVLLEFLGLAEDLVYFIRVRCITSAEPHRISAEYIVRCVAETIGP